VAVKSDSQQTDERLVSVAVVAGVLVDAAKRFCFLFQRDVQFSRSIGRDTLRKL
jgi:hypothetical protein